MPEYWWPLVSQARWFQGRGRNGRIADVHPLPWYTRPGEWPAIRSEIATVAYPDGGAEFYQLIAAYLDESDRGRDIAQHPGLLQLLWTAWHSPGTGTMNPHWDVDLAAALPAFPFTGEQTHSSVRFGDDVQVKFFRHLHGGAEVSLLRTLASSGSRRVPRLYGSASALVPGLGPTDLAMIVEFVASTEDGWESARAAAQARTSFASSAYRLGTDLRALHGELLGVSGAVSVPGAELVRQLADSAGSVAAGSAAAEHAARLISDASALDWTDEPVQRIHADLHLGQCLETERGWVFVDFEGEPLRTREGRRVNDSVWRDLAGMLRSFDYAAHVVDVDDAEAQAWIEECRGAFLEGYGVGSPMTRIGRLYELEKAIYEVAYERKYRPGWQHIPLGAVTDIGLDVAAWVAQGQE